MGVEPTAACSAQPATNFEDWGAHRDTITPADKFNPFRPIWKTLKFVSAAEFSVDAPNYY